MSVLYAYNESASNCENSSSPLRIDVQEPIEAALYHLMDLVSCILPLLALFLFKGLSLHPLSHLRAFALPMPSPWKATLCMPSLPTVVVRYYLFSEALFIHLI